MKHLLRAAFPFLLLLVSALSPRPGHGQTGKDAVLRVQKTSDFSVDGKGTAVQWAKTEWIPIAQHDTTERSANNPAPLPARSERKPPAALTTRAKVLYSDTGLYFLVQCEDRLLQATMEADFMRLWWEDVIEVFIWPDEERRTYFEYQISPLNYELIYRITRDERGRSSWRPSFYGGDGATRHMTSVAGGEKESGSSITQWTAEVFIPYTLLHPARNIPPEPGTQWRVNLYRMDYDTGGRTRWMWQPVEESHHDLEGYGTFLFD